MALHHFLVRGNQVDTGLDELLRVQSGCYYTPIARFAALREQPDFKRLVPPIQSSLPANLTLPGF